MNPTSGVLRWCKRADVPTPRPGRFGGTSAPAPCAGSSLPLPVWLGPRATPPPCVPFNACRPTLIPLRKSWPSTGDRRRPPTRPFSTAAAYRGSSTSLADRYQVGGNVWPSRLVQAHHRLLIAPSRASNAAITVARREREIPGGRLKTTALSNQGRASVLLLYLRSDQSRSIRRCGLCGGHGPFVDDSSECWSLSCECLGLGPCPTEPRVRAIFYGRLTDR